MGNLQIKNYRYERKFFINYLDRNAVEKIVLMHPAFFKEVYYERFINNIYFDFLNMNNYMDNINGNMYRTKYRIRWYGDMKDTIKESKLEIKIKKGLMGTKESHQLSTFSINNEITTKKIKDIINNSEICSLAKFNIEEQVPVLLNRYRRKYFETFDHKFRITIDDCQSFYKINSFTNFFTQKYQDLDSVILELKYDKEYEYLASSITNNLPFRLSKSSKYARGVQFFY